MNVERARVFSVTPRREMATPLVTGLTVAAAALAMRSVVTTIEAWALAGPRARAFYLGGFEPTMTRREAALILGVRESAAKGKVLEAHRRVMMANHPDAGGSAFLSTKINEAKALLLKGKSRASEPL
jgi:DnaJ family protein C protein 19